MDIVIAKPELLVQLDLIKAESLDGGSLRLFQNDYTPNPNSILADFTVADFSGYANKTIATWGASYLDDFGKATTVGGLQTFTQNADTTTNVVYGAYYLNAGGDLVWAVRFAEPVNFGGNGTTFNMVPKYQHGPIA